MVRLFILCWLFPTTCLAQENGEFFDYKSAFDKRDSVRSISIQCAFDNLRPTDGCNEIPDSIHYFKNLEYLSITETKVKTLPSSINKLSRLKRIHLGLNRGFNYDTELPKLVGLDSLESLDLWMTNFKFLPGSLSKIKTLKNVGISFNDQLDLKTTFKTLSLLPGLQSLDISGINRKNIPKNIRLLKKLTQIRFTYLRSVNLETCFKRFSNLDLEWLDLANDGIMKLPGEIGLLKHLVYLNLRDNFLSELPKEIYELPNLRTLNLYKSGLSNEQITEVQLKLPNCKILNEASVW